MYIIILVIVTGFTGLQAQQMPHYTQYMFNDFVINPAIAGVYDLLPDPDQSQVSVGGTDGSTH